MKQFAPTESFTIAISLNHCDWNGFNPFVCCETKFAIEALPAPTHASTSVGGS